MLQGGGPLPGLKNGLLYSPQTWIVWEDTCVDKARDFIVKGHLGGELEGEGIQENCSAMWFYGDGISFWIVPGQLLWLMALPGGAPITQLRGTPERRILGA